MVNKNLKLAIYAYTKTICYLAISIALLAGTIITISYFNLKWVFVWSSVFLITVVLPIWTVKEHYDDIDRLRANRDE